MPLTLTAQDHPAHIIKQGADIYTVAAGKRLQIRYQDGDGMVVVVDEKVPAGKTWEVSLSIHIKESDA